MTSAEPMAAPAPNLRFNKACELSDFSDPELRAEIREIAQHKLEYFPPDFPTGFEYNKDWEIAMAVRALRRFGALRPDARLLGVAAGMEDTIYYLSNHVGEVHVTDRYLSAAEWSPLAPASMLLEPERLSPIACRPDRIVVQHMDGRLLRYPDDTFDGIFSSGSIEHFGGMEDMATSAYEMGRVLKPGGVLAISTVVRTGGPWVGDGFPGTLVPNREQLLHYIVEASGLEPVDELAVDVDDATRATVQNLVQAIRDRSARSDLQRANPNPLPDYRLLDFPHVILDYEGCIFDSVHLALVKPARPSVDNSWARPSDALRESIHRYHIECLDRLEAAAPPPPAASSPSDGLGQSLELKARVDRALAGGRPESWHTCPIPLPQGPTFEIVVDGEAGDPITDAYLAGGGPMVDQDLVDLILKLVRPGDRVVDLGAFIGTFALPAAAHGCPVLAVDASPANVDLLRASAVRNGFRDLHVVHAAVSDNAGSLRFNAAGPLGHVATGDSEPGNISVPGVRVDDLLDGLGWPDIRLLKMDVEGYEIRALRGLGRRLAGPQAPLIVYECNGHTLAFFDLTPADLLAELESFGYVSYLIQAGRLIRTRPSELQPATVVNYLAVKGEPPALPGWRVEDGLGFEERVRLILNEVGYRSEHHSTYVARALAGAGQELLADPRIAGVIAQLRQDPSEAVRAAADGVPQP